MQPPYIVRRVAPRPRPKPRGGLRGLLDAIRADPRLRAPSTGYAAAALGVALASAFIALVQRFVHFGNISLVYLLVVLWLAATFGRGQAVLASVLAFLAFDYFFIPPLYQFTIDDPTEWISLSALLAASLVVGQVTAAAQARAHDALESQGRTATLYALSQLIVSAEPAALPPALVERVMQVFAAAGVAGCSIVLPDDEGRPVTRASEPRGGPLAASLDLADRAHLAEAASALRSGRGSGHAVRAGGAEQSDERVTLYLPLRSGNRVVGVLGLIGSANLRRLVVGAIWRPDAAGDAGADAAAGAAHEPQATLFAAFCDQIALALDHLALQQEAIHAEALRESDRLKTALLGSVTHDLRTPLASIQAAAGSLLDEVVAWSEGERRAFAETILTSADRLSRLVANLLDLSRLEAGVALPEKRWYPIADVIATVLDRLDLAGRLQGRRVEVDAPADLPLVPLDHAQIEQVLTNLIENALKYSPPTSPVRVEARIVGPPGALEVRVVDHGVGIPSSELRAIFDKFYRVQHVSLPWASGRPPAGTGLGLAICKGIVEAHGGSIWAESRQGEGSTFAVRLPIPDEGPRGTLPELEADTQTPPATTPAPPYGEE